MNTDSERARDTMSLIERLRAWSLYSFHEMHQEKARALFAEAADALAQHPSSGGEEALKEAVKPWAEYHGDLPDYDHPMRCVFESGVQYTVELLAKELDVKTWTPCDGTEEFDGDLGGTLMNIVCEALPEDEHGDRMHPRDVAVALAATPSPSAAGDRERWPDCNCPQGPFDDEVIYDRNLSPRCPRCNVALGGDPMTDRDRAAQEAEAAAATPIVPERSGRTCYICHAVYPAAHKSICSAAWPAELSGMREARVELEHCAALLEHLARVTPLRTIDRNVPLGVDIRETAARLAALSTPKHEVPAGDRIYAAASMALMYLQTGFLECEQCGHENSTAILDATYELAGAVQAAASTPEKPADGEVQS